MRSSTSDHACDIVIRRSTIVDGSGEEPFVGDVAIAEAVGLCDRGRVAVGMKADVNVIEMDRLLLGPLRPSYHLPTGGRRLLEQAQGSDATIVSGVVTYRDGKHTGALPGRLVRGAKPGPDATAGAPAAEVA